MNCKSLVETLGGWARAPFLKKLTLTIEFKALKGLEKKQVDSIALLDPHPGKKCRNSVRSNIFKVSLFLAVQD